MRTFFKPGKIHFDPTSDEDLTIPDDALSVRDILSRYTRSHLDDLIEDGDDDDIDADDSIGDDLVDISNNASKIEFLESSLLSNGGSPASPESPEPPASPESPESPSSPESSEFSD